MAAPDPAFGKVYLIGVGPGDIELLTLKAVRCIGLVDVILMDSLANPEVLKFAKEDVEVINVGKRGGRESTSQAWIEEQLIAHARSGKNVARIKGGDPVIFARGGEELEAIFAAGIEAEVVSGITSGIAVPAALGIPLTHRDMSHQVIFVNGPSLSDEAYLPLPNLSEFQGTIVVYMGLGKSAQVAKKFIAQGMSPDMPVAAIQSGTLPGQKFVFSPLNKLAEKIAEAGLSSPVLIVVGEVVTLSKHYKPLAALVR